MEYMGLVGYVGFLYGFLNEILKHLFKLDGDTMFSWGHDAASNYGTYAPSTTQWTLNLPVNLPDLTDKGEDIVAAIMTIAHNGLIFVAQLSTLLPFNGTQ